MSEGDGNGCKDELITFDFKHDKVKAKCGK